MTGEGILRLYLSGYHNAMNGESGMNSDAGKAIFLLFHLEFN
jgi:hypothetical protein